MCEIAYVPAPAVVKYCWTGALTVIEKSLSEVCAPAVALTLNVVVVSAGTAAAVPVFSSYFLSNHSPGDTAGPGATKA